MKTKIDREEIIRLILSYDMDVKIAELRILSNEMLMHILSEIELALSKLN